MHTLHILSLLAASGGIASARPVSRRSVPHEHAHEANLVAVRQLLQQNNPGGLGDPVFGLLGAAAAAQGAAGNDPDCLQQLVADQAFSNAKAAGDTQGMIEALVCRTIERNTGRVGLASPLCTAVQAKNPEVAALTQHQDAAGGAATQAANKEIALELARQIASFGGDPQEAIKSGTFAPGDLNDNTGKGGTCDDLDDPAGCIFTRNLPVPDVTPEEIDAAVAGIGGAGNQGNAGKQANNGNTGSGIQAGQGNQVNQNSASNNGNNNAAADGNAGIAAPTQNAAVGGGGAATSIQEAAGLTANVDLGDCPNIALAFGQNIEGRKETSFIPANLQQFNHGSALNVDIITTFMCDQLINQCGLTTADEGHITCKEAAAAIANDPRDGAAADKFNNFFGIQTNFAPIPVVDNQGRTVGAGGTAGSGAVATAVSVPAGNGGNNAGSNNAANNAGGIGSGNNNGDNSNSSGGNANAGNANAGTNAAVGANFQKFAGGLGVTPPAVTAGGRGFVVANNADFLNLNAALGRSCDVFKNQCANQANSGADFSVSDCEGLADQCRALI